MGRLRGRGRHGWMNAGARRTSVLVTLVLAVVCLLAPGASAAGFGPSAPSAWGPASSLTGGSCLHAARARHTALCRAARRARAARLVQSSRRTTGALLSVRALPANGTIEGVVTDALTSAGIKGVEVCAWELGRRAICTKTGESGKYELEVPAGQYHVAFLTPTGSPLNYITQYWQDASSQEAAKPVNVSAGGKLPGIDATMREGGRIEGRVTSVASPKPGLPSVYVCVSDEAGYFGCVETDVSGKYRLSGLPAGKYEIAFVPLEGNFLEAFEESVTVELKKAVTVNVELPTGGEISGTVTSAATGLGVYGVKVCALLEFNEIWECATSTTGGAYTIEQLPTATYAVEFRDPGAYPTQFYDQAFTLGGARPVGVIQETVTSGVNDALASPPANTVQPSVSGGTTAGATLTCILGAWSGSPAPALSVQWLRDGAPITSASGPSYVTTVADVGHAVSCRVTARNVAGEQSAASGGIQIAAAPVAEGKVSVLPSITVVPVVSAASRVLTSKHFGSVRLRCQGGTCKGVVEMYVRVVVHHHARNLVLATGTFSLPAGTSANVLLRLTAAGRARLAHASRHAVPAKLKLSLHGGATTVRSVSAS